MKILAAQRLQANVPNWEEDISELRDILKRAFPKGDFETSTVRGEQSAYFENYHSPVAFDINISKVTSSKVAIEIGLELAEEGESIEVEAFGETLAVAWKAFKRVWVKALQDAQRDYGVDMKDFIRKVNGLRNI